jgi:hypothetical protein
VNRLAAGARLRDVRIIDALYRLAASGGDIKLR